MAATNSAFADEIVVTVEPEEEEDDVEDHLDCSVDLSGISGQQQSRNCMEHGVRTLSVKIIQCILKARHLCTIIRVELEN